MSHNITWFFGASSSWSQKIINDLDGEVIQFSRNTDIGSTGVNTQYTKEGVIKLLITIAEFETPSRIIFNINTGTPDSLLENTQSNIEVNYNLFNKWWEENNEQLFFRYCLIDYLINTRNFIGDVCFITSQISADHNPAWSHLLTYKNLRAIEYELIWNFRNRGVNAYGICPATNARPMEWAEFISKFIQSENVGNSYWLYGVTEDEKTRELAMLKYPIEYV